MTVAVSAPSADPALVADLVADRVASRIAAGDSTLWGPAAEEEAALRLGWVDLYETSRPLLAEIDALTADLRGAGLDRVVICGMGGSSLAPEVITRTAGVRSWRSEPSTALPADPIRLRTSRESTRP